MQVCEAARQHAQNKHVQACNTVPIKPQDAYSFAQNTRKKGRKPQEPEERQGQIEETPLGLYFQPNIKWSYMKPRFERQTSWCKPNTA